MRRATLLLLLALRLGAQTGSIHGVVKDQATGAPLAGVEVRTAQPVGIGVGADGELRPGITNAEGQFKIAKLAAGSLLLEAVQRGVAPVRRRIILAAGSDLTV